VKLFENFDAKHIPDACDLVIYSAAYSRDANPELKAAAAHNIPIYSYPEVLGALSLHSTSAGIAGVHGKTTTTALTGILMEALSMPATVLAGSAISNFNNRLYPYSGRYLLSLQKHASTANIFSISSLPGLCLLLLESDHQDYFPTYESIRDAFVEYVLSLPSGGTLIFCADEKGATEVADIALQQRKDINFVEYGFSAQGKWKIRSLRTLAGTNTFITGNYPVDISLHVPGQHLVLDAVAALALADSIFKAETSRDIEPHEWK